MLLLERLHAGGHVLTVLTYFWLACEIPMCDRTHVVVIISFRTSDELTLIAFWPVPISFFVFGMASYVWSIVAGIGRV